MESLFASMFTQSTIMVKSQTDRSRLANLAVPSPGIRFKASAMPFVQMENISLFLRACQSPPLGLQPHDVFLTVDLYESKDPAQVLQCLGAFSRVANQLQPTRFPTAIGPKSRAGVMSPQGTGTQSVGGGSFGNRGRGVSNASNNSSAYSNSAYSNSRTAGTITPTKTGDGRWSPTKTDRAPMSPGASVSSWSKKQDEGATSPAWNIAQYGYMGGASQGNLGVSFGGRRQITSAGPSVPNLAEKEKKRREAEAEAERQRVQMEEEEHRRRMELEAEEERLRVEEEERWAAEAQRLREEEKRKAEEEKRKWEEEERRWKADEEQRQREEREAEAMLEKERRRGRGNSDARLQGQFLSQYQAEQDTTRENGNGLSRVEELERELELARERERKYERERQDRMRSRGAVEDHDFSVRMKEESQPKSRPRSRSRPRLERQKTGEDSWRQDEREYLRREYAKHHEAAPAPSKSPRPLPDPAPPVRVKTNHTGPSSRPLPDPAAYNPQAPVQSGATHAQQLPNRTDRYLQSNPAPQQQKAHTTYASELGAFDSTAERDAEDRRRAASQQKTKAGGWASKSLLEREMEMERQRQQEWEDGQKATAAAAKSGVGKDGVDGIGGGIGGKWDVNQWTGYTGGDGQNRGAQGIGAGRRQIVGPRPPPPGR